MEPLPISVIVLVKDEELALPACLCAVADFAEVFVVDSNSADRTPEIVQRASASLLNFTWNGEYPKKKQWAIDNVPAVHDWLLLLDADEIVSKSLFLELKMLVDDHTLQSLGAVDIPLDYEWNGRRLRYGHKVVKRSLVHRERALFPVVDDLAVSSMWEVEGHYQPETDWPTGRTTSALIHRDPDPLNQWFARHNRYSDWEAYLSTAGARHVVDRRRSRQGRLFQKIPGKPLAFFIYSFLLRAGFRDGRAGFDYAIAQAFYYWQTSLKTRELRERGPKLAPSDAERWDSNSPCTLGY